MTKTEPKKRTRKPAPPRIVTSDDDAFLFGMAARAAEMTQAEFFAKHFRDTVRKMLARSGADPDKLLASRTAGRS